MRSSIHDLNLLLLISLILCVFMLCHPLPLPAVALTLLIILLNSMILCWIVFLQMDIRKMLLFCQKVRAGNYEQKPVVLSRNDEIADLNQEIATMKDYLQSMHSAKSQMIQNISHNLKTPLSVIMLSCEMLLDGDVEPTQVQPYYRQIYQVSEKMLTEIQRLLDLNRINHLITLNEPCTQETQMKELIENRVEAFAPFIEKRKLQIELALYPVAFKGKAEHWETVIDNLLENAVRYAETTIKIRCYPQSLAIYNDGIRLSSSMIHKIFDPYVKGEKGKSGLGLAIVQSIADLYDYRVIAENKTYGVEFKIIGKGAIK